MPVHMTPPVRKMYKESAKNEEFQKQFKTADPEYKKLTIFSSELERLLHAVMYQGWLTARGEFVNSKYY